MSGSGTTSFATTLVNSLRTGKIAVLYSNGLNATDYMNFDLISYSALSKLSATGELPKTAESSNAKEKDTWIIDQYRQGTLVLLTDHNVLTSAALAREMGNHRDQFGSDVFNMIAKVFVTEEGYKRGLTVETVSQNDSRPKVDFWRTRAYVNILSAYSIAGATTSSGGVPQSNIEEILGMPSGNGVYYGNSSSKITAPAFVPISHATPLDHVTLVKMVKRFIPFTGYVRYSKRSLMFFRGINLTNTKTSGRNGNANAMSKVRYDTFIHRTVDQVRTFSIANFNRADSTGMLAAADSGTPAIAGVTAPNPNIAFVSIFSDGASVGLLDLALEHLPAEEKNVQIEKVKQAILKQITAYISKHDNDPNRNVTLGINDLDYDRIMISPLTYRSQDENARQFIIDGKITALGMYVLVATLYRVAQVRSTPATVLGARFAQLIMVENDPTATSAQDLYKSYQNLIQTRTHKEVQVQPVNLEPEDYTITRGNNTVPKSTSSAKTKQPSLVSPPSLIQSGASISRIPVPQHMSVRAPVAIANQVQQSVVARPAQGAMPNMVMQGQAFTSRPATIPAPQNRFATQRS